MKAYEIDKKSSNGTRTTIQNDNGNSKCACSTLFYQGFRQLFYNLGYTIGKHPSYFIIIPIFVTLLGLTGLQRINIIKDPDYLFIPSDSLSKTTRDIIEKYFPMNSTDKFDPSRITRPNDFAKLLITAKDNGTMLRQETWDELNLLDELVQNITIVWEDNRYNYSEICSKWEGECFQNLIYNLNEVIPEVVNGSMLISYPVMLFPLVLPLFYGGAVVNETEGLLESTQGVYTIYFLAHDNWKQKERAYLWEGALLNLLESTEFNYIQVERYTSRSLGEELAKNSEYMKMYLPIAFCLLFVFSILTVSTVDWVRTKTQMGLIAILTVIMSIVSSFGFLMYIGVPYIPINSAIPFLVLAIALDDMYIILSSWRRTNIQDSVASRMAETFSDVAISVTLTSLTNLVSFFIGATSTFPAVQIFCVYLGTTVLFSYFLVLTFFGACLVLVGFLEKNQRHALSCKSVKAKSLSDNYCYSIWCAGGINPQDPWNPKDNRKSFLTKFFKDYYGKALCNKGIKVFVVLLYIAYIGGAIYGSQNIKQGIDKHNIGTDGSYLTKYYEVEDELFRKYPYRIQVVITDDNFSFTNNETQKILIDLHKAVEANRFVGQRLFTRSWMRGFFSYLDRRPELAKNLTDEATFLSYMANNYLYPDNKETLDYAFNENKTKVLATRFVVQGFQVKDMEEDFQMVQELRDIAKDFPYEIYFYHPSFVYYDQYLAVGPSALRTTCTAALIMILASLLFIPYPLSALWVGLSILSINFGVVGYMALWDVRLDTIALVNLIMCIGFSVDYSAHMSYTYLTNTSKRSSDKVRQSLYKMGIPVLQCGFSTILAIVVFVFTPSYINRAFFKIIFLVTIFGMVHSLIILPVFFSLFEDIFCKSKRQDDASSTASSSISGDANKNSIPSFKIKEKISINSHKTITESISNDSGVNNSDDIEIERL